MNFVYSTDILTLPCYPIISSLYRSDVIRNFDFTSHHYSTSETAPIFAHSTFRVNESNDVLIDRRSQVSKRYLNWTELLNGSWLRSKSGVMPQHPLDKRNRILGRFIWSYVDSRYTSIKWYRGYHCGTRWLIVQSMWRPFSENT